MDYPIDISIPKVQKAMKALKISTEDIAYKTLSSFSSPGVSQAIQSLRFKHHTDRSKSLVKKLKDFLKASDKLTGFSARNSKLLTQKSGFRSDHNERYKENYQQRFLRFFEIEKKIRKEEIDVVRKCDRDKKIKEMTEEVAKERKEKNEARSNRQRENMKLLEIQEETNFVKATSRIQMRSRAKTPSSMRTRTPAEREKSSRQGSDDFDDIHEKLERFNRKMHKSSENYNRVIRDKIFRIKVREKGCFKGFNSLDSTLMIADIISKHEDAHERREKLKKESYEKINEKMSKKNEKINYILEKSALSSTTDQAKKIEKKLEKASKFIEKVRIKQKTQIEFKQERQKLLDQDATENRERLKCINNLKKKKIIHKHLELTERQKFFNQILDVSNRKSREKAMEFTKQRERTLELRARISKSQTPDKIMRFLDYD